MTEYEYLELFAMTRQQAATDGMNCLVIISAYLVAAYVAGRRLPSLFLWPIVILYTLFLFGPVGATVNGFRRMDAVMKEFADRFPDSSLIEPVSGPGAYVTSGVAVAGWALSLIFTIYIRKPSAGPRESE